MDRKPSVLVVAEMCNPDWVSVPLVGWSHARALCAVARPHLVTAARNRANIERAGLVEGRDFTSIDTGLDGPAGRLLKAFGVPLGSNKGWTLLAAVSAVGYYRFERMLWQRLGARVRRGEFDLVHRLTPVSPATPSLLAGWVRRAGLPFVIGPLNGGLPWPKGFNALRLKEREWLSYARGAHRLLPGYRATRENASAILVGSRATRAELAPRHLAKTIYLPENAIDPERFDAPAPAPAPPPLRIAFVGRLVPYKGADMLLEAAAPLARAGLVSVDLIGDGPELPALRALAERESIAQAVAFAGWVEHRLVQKRLAGCHLFGFPSVREFGGGAVAEAMALGLVPIVTDFGGPGEIASPDTGFILPLGGRHEIVASLRSLLGRLVADPSALPAMSQRARRRALALFTWPAKAGQTRQVYDWVLGRGTKPDFGMPLADAPVEAEAAVS